MKSPISRFLGHTAGWLLSVVLSAPVLAEGNAWIDPVSGVEFVRLPKGCFMMGEDPPGTRNASDVPPFQRPDEQPRHSACVGEFWMARTELTWQQWQQVSGLALPPRARPAQAANGLSWHDARRWLQQLNEKSGASPEIFFRLPAEVEWEYACRAGVSEPVFSGDVEALGRLQRELTRSAWYKVPDFPDRWAHDVGKKAPNAWGLSDMLGNVMEWVEDRYKANAYMMKVAGTAHVDDAERLRGVRGGSFKSYDNAVRCGARAALDEDDRLPVAGMRVAMERRDGK